MYGGSDNVNSLLSIYLGGVEPIDYDDLYGGAKSPKSKTEPEPETETIMEDATPDEEPESIMEDAGSDFSSLIEMSDFESTKTNDSTYPVNKSAVSKKNHHDAGYENNLHADIPKEYTAGSHDDDSDNLADALLQLLAPVSIE